MGLFEIHHSSTIRRQVARDSLAAFDDRPLDTRGSRGRLPSRQSAVLQRRLGLGLAKLPYQVLVQLDAAFRDAMQVSLACSTARVQVRRASKNGRR